MPRARAAGVQEALTNSVVYFLPDEPPLSGATSPSARASARDAHGKAARDRDVDLREMIAGAHEHGFAMTQFSAATLAKTIGQSMGIFYHHPIV
jgi:hypothetical protein